MGKSSMLMWLHLAGIPVLADDLVVVDGVSAYTGPRCLDLREEAASRFGHGHNLGVIGTRERWRVDLPGQAGSVRFGGWVLLGWGQDICLHRPTAVNSIAALANHRALRAPGANTTRLIGLLDYPMIGFGRPNDWSQMDQAMTDLIDAIDAI